MKGLFYAYVIFAALLMLVLATACGSPEHFERRSQVIVEQPDVDMEPCPEEQGPGIEVGGPPTDWQDSISEDSKKPGKHK